MYEKMARLLNIQVRTSVGIDATVMKMTKDDLLILDEADWHLLDQISDLPMTSYGVIAMTATEVGNQYGVEKKRLDTLKMTIHDSKIPANFDVEQVLQRISDVKFIDRERLEHARLIWCTEDKQAHFRKLAEDWGYDVLHNHRNIADLRELTQQYCLIITDIELMRGVDYHTPEFKSGIDLLIARDFPNTRAYTQGLGRVGRYGEACNRWVWDKFTDSIVNEKEEAELRGKIGSKTSKK